MYILRPAPVLPFGRTSLLLMSDLHIGSAETDYRAIERDLQWSPDARILLNGDIFDAIIASDEKRYRPAGLHKRLHGRTDILNASVDWAYELLAPHAERILMLGIGNHCTAIEHHCSVDLGLLLADRLGCPYGGYTGYVDFRFADRAKHRQRFVLWYHHGSGGGASLSGAAGEFTKKLAFVDADVIWLGHRHFKVTSHMRRLRCPTSGDKPMYTDVRYLMTGAYMDVWTRQRRRPRNSSYAEDRALPPQGKGGMMLHLDVSRRDVAITTEVR